MDRKTRGNIEDAFNIIIEKLDARNVLEILDRYPIRSKAPENLALGYMLGYMDRVARAKVLSWRIEKKFEARRRKIDKEFEEKHGRKPPKIEKSEDVKVRRISWSKKDLAEIMDMLRRRVPDVVDKVVRELNR